MNHDYKVSENISRCIQSAIEKDFYSALSKKPQEIDLEVYVFPEIWGSTALGFNGLGGQAMTMAHTVVIAYQNHVAVYFGGMFAYLVPFTNAVKEDMVRQHMAPVSRCNKYLEE